MRIIPSGGGGGWVRGGSSARRLTAATTGGMISSGGHPAPSPIERHKAVAGKPERLGPLLLQRALLPFRADNGVDAGAVRCGAMMMTS